MDNVCIIWATGREKKGLPGTRQVPRMYEIAQYGMNALWMAQDEGGLKNVYDQSSR